MPIKIEGHDCMLFADRDRAILAKLRFRGRVRWVEQRVRAMLLRPLETLRPTNRGRTEEDVHSLLAFATLLFDGVESFGGFYAGRRGDHKTFKTFVRDYMGPEYAARSASLRDDFRNGLAHGFVVKNGGFEFFRGKSIRTGSGGVVEIDPDKLFRDFKRAIRAYFKAVRAGVPTSRIGSAFLSRFHQNFGVP